MNTFTFSPAILGFLKALGIVIIVSVLSFLGDQANLNSILSPVIASIIAALAAALESNIKAKTGNAFFGAVRAK